MIHVTTILAFGNSRNFFLKMSLITLLASCSNVSEQGKSSATFSSTGADSVSITATNSRTQYAEINGRKIAYRTIGKGDPIILCLRFRGNLDSWDPAFLDELAKNYQVITFNYSGFGSSTGNPPTNMMGFANDVKDLAAALDLKKFIVGGWSFGGAVAQIVTTEMPDLVTHTVLIGTRPPGKFRYYPEEVFLKTSRKVQNDLEDEIVLFFEPTSEMSRKKARESHERIAERPIDKDVDIRQEVWSNYVLGFSDFERDLYSAREKLAKTHIPVLVISADHEVVFPPENWFELNRKMRTMQLVVIPQTGHGPQQQYPAMVAAYIHSFIQNR